MHAIVKRVYILYSLIARVVLYEKQLRLAILATLQEVGGDSSIPMNIFQKMYLKVYMHHKHHKRS